MLDAVTRVRGDVAVPSGAGPPGDGRRRVGPVGEPDPTGGLADEFGDLAVVPDPATIQHDDALAQGCDVLGPVGGQDHDRRARELREHGTQRDELFRVDAGGRLVEDQHRRRPEQRVRQRDPSPLAAGHGPDPFRRGAGQPDLVEYPAHFRVPGRRLGPLLEQCDVVDKPERGEAARETDLLRQVAQPAADLGTIGRYLRVPAQHAHLSLAGRQRGGQHAQQGGLAGAVRAKQPDHAGLQVQVDVGQRPGGPEGAPDATQTDRSGHRRYLQGRSWCRWRRRTRKVANDAAASTRKATWVRGWSTAVGEADRAASRQTVSSQTVLTAMAAFSGLTHVDAASTTATKPTAGSSHANGASPGTNSPSSSTAGSATASTAIVRSRISRRAG